jgi:hypothetical protein
MVKRNWIAIPAGLLLAMCAPGAVEMVGDAMVDVGTEMRDAAASDAAAQTGSCMSGNWAIRGVSATSPTLPAGWEPFAVAGTGSSGGIVGDTVWLRQCMP